MAEMRRFGKRYNFHCPQCGLAFSAQKDLSAHEATHDNGTFSLQPMLSSTTPARRFYPCTTCPQSFSKFSLLRLHQAVCCVEAGKSGNKADMAKKSVKTFECSTCYLTFVCHANLLRHERMHAEELCTCSLCGASFGSTASARVHLWKVHKMAGEDARSEISFKSKPLRAVEAVVPKPLPAPPKPSTGGAPTVAKDFTCVLCNKTFQYDFSFHAHMNIHTLNGELPKSTFPSLDDRPFPCVHCNKAFRTAVNLSTHTRNCKVLAAAKSNDAPITISQFADLVQRGFVDGDAIELDGDGTTDDPDLDGVMDLGDLATGFSDHEDVTVVPALRLPSSLMSFLMSGSGSVGSGDAFEASLVAKSSLKKPKPEPELDINAICAEVMNGGSKRELGTSHSKLSTDKPGVEERRGEESLTFTELQPRKSMKKQKICSKSNGFEVNVNSRITELSGSKASSVNTPRTRTRTDGSSQRDGNVAVIRSSNGSSVNGDESSTVKAQNTASRSAERETSALERKLVPKSSSKQVGACSNETGKLLECSVILNRESTAI